METVVIIQSAVLALLGYYLYVAYKDLQSLRAQIDWVGNEIYAIKSQLKNLQITAIGSKITTAKRRVESKTPINKPKKDKP